MSQTKHEKNEKSIVNRVEKDLTDNNFLDKSDTKGDLLGHFVNNGFTSD